MNYTSTPSDWGRHITDALSRMVPCTRCVAYRIDSNLQQTDHVTHDGQRRWVAPYRQKFMNIDPLCPPGFLDRPETVVVPGLNFSMSALRKSDYYKEFMKPLDLHYKVEMFFRDPAGGMIAGARISRGHDEGPFRQEELALLHSVQPIMEAFSQRVLSARGASEDRLDPLTRRERQVAMLVAEGLSNDQIRQHTGTSLATVKSQLSSAFRKLNINRRTELVAMIRQ